MLPPSPGQRRTGTHPAGQQNASHRRGSSWTSRENIPRPTHFFSMQAPEFAIGVGTLALINAGLAEGKNRSRLAWFLLSLLLGPIATFIIVVVDRAKK
jgi:hypothetical protein